MNEMLTVGELADLIGDALRKAGQSLESMLAVLRQERARIFAERYPEASDQDEESK